MSKLHTKELRNPDDDTQPTYEMTPGLLLLSLLLLLRLNP